MRQIQNLFKIERELQEQKAGPALREAVRQWQSRPIIERIKRALFRIKANPACLPESLIGKAIDYTLNQSTTLEVYLDDGRVEISNNLVENAIRPTKLGAKNWMFIGAEDAGWRSAVLYSLITSCKNRGVEPYSYFCWLFKRLPNATNQQITELTPKGYAQVFMDRRGLAS